jgi:DNA helicase II / ATP-dependent DNA helicase PcrA
MNHLSYFTQLKEQLNPAQYEAVETIEGPLLVLAGAGSGKTRVVTFRIVNLLERNIPPSKILGLTFTNKAAEEMKERVRQISQNQVLICTFHSLGVRILREAIPVLGYGKDFTIYDEQDSEKVIKVCLNEVVGAEKMEPKTFLNLISNAKNALLSPEESMDLENKDRIEKLLPKVYSLYQTKLKAYQAVDFDDLLFLPIRLFREYPNVREYYQNQWSFLLIDEYQDTNEAQYTMIQYLAAKHHNLCVVGDPDQSIYSWRGANMKNILNFEKDYPGTKVIRLEQNYRSSSNILNAANVLIECNTQRYEKKLWSNKGPGEKIGHFTADTERGEAEFVAEKVHYHNERHHIPLNQMVVFYRTNAQSRSFEDRFLSHRIPYVIVGGISFYHRREIKDVLAFLRLVHSGNDFVSFSRTINLPKRGIGETTIEKIRQGATQENLALLSFCEALTQNVPLHHPIKLSAKQKEALKQYVEMITGLKEVHKACSLTELVKTAILSTHYLDYLKEDKETFAERKENLDALIAKAAEWEISSQNPSLGGFLEELSLKSSLDEANSSKERVHLMTIHNGKGLEFAVTFLVGLEEDLFPHANSRDDARALEEERRLCYVGMTRAKEYLYLCDVRQRFLWGTTRMQRPSRFLREIPSEYVNKIKQSYQSRETVLPRRGSEAPAKVVLEEELSFASGDAVFHKEFGIGVVREVYKSSVGLTYKIFFSKGSSEKNIVAKYAHLKKL